MREKDEIIDYIKGVTRSSAGGRGGSSRARDGHLQQSESLCAYPTLQLRREAHLSTPAPRPPPTEKLYTRPTTTQLQTFHVTAPFT